MEMRADFAINYVVFYNRLFNHNIFCQNIEIVKNIDKHENNEHMKKNFSFRKFCV